MIVLFTMQEYAEKNAKLMARRGQLMQGHLSRAEVVALMKRTRSVSTPHTSPTHTANECGHLSLLGQR